MLVLPSYRHQSNDLHSNSIDWYLYEGNTGTWWVKEKGYYDVKKSGFFNFMRSKQYIKILTVNEYMQVLREADIARCSLNAVGVKLWEYIETVNFKKSEIEKLVKNIFQENCHIFRIT